MRSRLWLLPAVLVMLAVAPSARANDDAGYYSPPNPFAAGTKFDQRAMISEMQGQLTEPYFSPRHWLDVGVAIPVGSFNDETWDPGLLIRWSERVWREGPFSLVGSAGVLFNDDARFNEGQVDASYAAGPGSLIPIDSRRHIAFPFAVQLHLEPASEDSWSPFIAVGPAVQYTHEAQVHQEWTSIVTDSTGTTGPGSGFAVPSLSPTVPVPLAQFIVTKTHFHPGAQATGGIRFRMGHGSNPLHM